MWQAGILFLVGTIALLPIVFKIMAAVGIGYATYTGMTSLLETAVSQVELLFTGIPADMLQIMAMTNIDKYITMVFSAYTMRLIIAGVSGGQGLTRFVLGQS